MTAFNRCLSIPLVVVDSFCSAAEPVLSQSEEKLEAVGDAKPAVTMEDVFPLDVLKVLNAPESRRTPNSPGPTSSTVSVRMAMRVQRRYLVYLPMPPFELAPSHLLSP